MLLSISSRRGASVVTIFIVVAVMALIAFFVYTTFNEKLSDLSSKTELFENEQDVSVPDDEYLLERGSVEKRHTFNKLDLYATLSGQYVSSVDNVQAYVTTAEADYLFTDVLDFGDYHSNANIVIMVEAGSGDQYDIGQIIDYFRKKQQAEKQVNAGIYQYDTETTAVVEMTDSLPAKPSLSSSGSSQTYLYDAVLESFNIMSEADASDSAENTIIIFSSGANTGTNVIDINTGNTISTSNLRTKINEILEPSSYNIYFISESCSNYNIKNLKSDGCFESVDDIESILDSDYKELNRFYVSYEHQPGLGEHNVTVKIFRNDMSGSETFIINA